LVGPIRYDAGRSRFRRGGTVGIDLAVAAQALRNPIGEEARALRSYGESASRTLELVKQVLAYQVPVYRIETDQEDSGTIAEMAKAFIRLNAAGERISNVELLLSLMGGTWAPRIREAIQAGHDLVTDGWDIDLLPYIRLVLHNLGISQSVASHPERFESAVRSLSDAARIDDVALDSARSLDAAGRLLQHELGIPNASLLTSQNVLVPIAAYIRKRSDEVLTATEQTAISHWFLLASLKGRYSGSPDTKLEQDLRIVADASGGFPLEQLVQSMRPADQKILWRDLDRGRRVNGLRREGRPYLLLLWALLAKRGATDWAGRNFTKAPWGTLTRHHIFPQNFLDQEVPEDDPATEWVHSAANITWVNDAINAEIGDTPPSEYIGKEVPLEEARHHFIPLDTPHLLQAEHYEDFLGERMRMIFQATQDEFAPIVG